ncbi:solute carrier family 45 member 3-like [Ptychodera flava]|uniref:solute carrier family 45 member 3-like n=1 Tax=Ptychodera flava TaxID=63121 RepID=UPI00396A2BAE
MPATDTVSILTATPSLGLGHDFRLSYLLSLNSIICGLELCTSAAFSYIPPMLLKAGFSEGSMSFVMGLGPVFALILVPLLGVYSDQCTSRYGRRRPFIFYFSVGTIVTLVIIPYGSATGKISLALAVIVLDFCTQACYTPFEALLSDCCTNPQQHNRCFTVFSFMTSIGGCIGYWLTSIDWTQTRWGTQFSKPEKAVFSILLVIFTSAAVTSLLLARDTPAKPCSSTKPTIHKHDTRTKDMSDLTEKIDKYLQKSSISKFGESKSSNGDLSMKILISDGPVFYGNDINGRNLLHNLVKTRTKISNMGLLSRAARKLLPDAVVRNIQELQQSVITMPAVLARLWTAHFVTTTAIMGFKLFFTDFVGTAIFNGNPDAAEGSESQNLYDAGVRMGSWGLLLHGITAAIYSACLEALVSTVGTRRTYMFGIFTFAVATSFIVFTRNMTMVLWLSALTGCAYATVTALPYTLLTTYHENLDRYYMDLSVDKQHLHGKGTDVALLDSAYFLSETVSAFLFGLLVHWTGTTAIYMVCSAIFAFMGCVYVLRISY